MPDPQDWKHGIGKCLDVVGVVVKLYAFVAALHFTVLLVVPFLWSKVFNTPLAQLTLAHVFGVIGSILWLAGVGIYSIVAEFSSTPLSQNARYWVPLILPLWLYFSVVT